MSKGNIKEGKRAKQSKKSTEKENHDPTTLLKKIFKNKMSLTPSTARRNELLGIVGENMSASRPNNKTRLSPRIGTNKLTNALQSAGKVKESWSKIHRFRARKFERLQFMERAGSLIKAIAEGLEKKNDVYEYIRLYADFAQEPDFDNLVSVLSSPKAQVVFSRVMKLERFAVVLLFYFKVTKKESDPLSNLLEQLFSKIWINHNCLLNWIKELNILHDLEWVIEDHGRIYSDLEIPILQITAKISNTSTAIGEIFEKM